MKAVHKHQITDLWCCNRRLNDKKKKCVGVRGSEVFLNDVSTFVRRAHEVWYICCLYYTNGNEMKLKQQKVQWTSYYKSLIQSNKTVLIFKMPLTQFAVICKFIDCGIATQSHSIAQNKWFSGTLSFILAFDFRSEHHRSKTEYAEKQKKMVEEKAKKKKEHSFDSCSTKLFVNFIFSGFTKHIDSSSLTFA